MGSFSGSGSGSRSRRWSRLLVAAGVAVVSAVPLFAPVAQAAPAAGCQLNELPALAGASRTEVSGGDPSGRYLIGNAVVQGDHHVPVLWVDGNAQTLPGLAPTAALKDVNSNGVVIGNTFTADVNAGFVFRDGKTSTLPPLAPGDSGYATAINARGDIVGVNTKPGSPSGLRQAVLWRAGQWNAPPVVLAVPEGPSAGAVDVDDDGTVLLMAGFAGASSSPYVWRNGVVAELQNPDGHPAEAFVIRNGRVAGTTFTKERNGAVIRWTLGSNPARATAELLAGYRGVAAINAGAAVAMEGPGATSALAHPDGTVRTLPALHAVGGTRVAALSDSGVAAGNAWVVDNPVSKPVTWSGC